MAIGRPPFPLRLPEEEKEQVESMACSLTLPQGSGLW